MLRKQYEHMKDDDVTALVKLVRNCGIHLNDAINLQKENFNLEQKTILFKPIRRTRIRMTTIRPNDVEWFRVWLADLSEKVFPFSIRSIYYQLHKITSSPYSIRKELWDEMRDLGAKDGIIAVKMGYFIDVDPDKKTKLFLELQQWEEKHFGGNT